MLEVDIPGFGLVKLEYLVSDFTGTLSFDGHLLPQVREKLGSIAQSLKIFVVTADEFGTAREELKGIDCSVHIIQGEDLDAQKAEFVSKLGAERTATMGNGTNDRKMLKVSRIGIIVVGREGCAVEALLAADVQVTSAVDGIDLLLNPKRLKATLKF